MDQYRLNLAVPRGMLFLYDWDNLDAEIPEYNEDTTVSGTLTALSIALISDEDGRAEIVLGEAESQEELPFHFGVFSLNCPNMSLSLCVMGDEEVERIAVTEKEIEVSVSGNADKFPSSIFISSRHFVRST
jgi:hypothetical protein